MNEIKKDIKKTADSCILHGVPKVYWGRKVNGKEQSSPCPMSLQSILNYMGQDISYTELMAYSGAAFRQRWDSNGWNIAAIDIRFTYDNDQLLPFKLALKGAGRQYEISEKGKSIDKADAMALIKSEIDSGRPLIGLGVVGPGEAGIITGYKNNGETILGWSFFQDFWGGCDFDESGYFIKDDWWAEGVIAVSEELSTCTSDKEILENAYMLMTTDQVRPYGGNDLFYGGQKAYESWASALEKDSGGDFGDEQNDAERMLGEDRGYAADYMTLMAEKYPNLASEFKEFARHLQAAADNVPKIGEIKKKHGLESKQARKQIAALIRQAAKDEKEACTVLEDIIGKMYKQEGTVWKPTGTKNKKSDEMTLDKWAYVERGLALCEEGKFDEAAQDYHNARTLFEAGEWNMRFEDMLGELDDKLTEARGLPNNVSQSDALPLTEVKVGDIIPFGKYQWRVLDVEDNAALIISDIVVRRSPYHKNRTKITWENCDLRKYLNETFYDTFSEAEKSKIKETNISDCDNPWHGVKCGNPTVDKIFLLSFDEVVQYFGDSGELLNNYMCGRDAINDEYNEARKVKNDKGADGWWWLRSPGGQGQNTTGSIGTLGEIWLCGDDVNRRSGGVRPAMWITIK